MKRTGFVLLLLFAATASVVGQFFQARVVTSGYAWQRHDTVGVTSHHLFGHQLLHLTIARNALSLHSYMQGFNDFAGPVKNDPQFRLFNLYAKASNIAGIVDVAVGRQLIFAGVGTGTIDGGLVGIKVPQYGVKLNAYYGFLPPPRMKAYIIHDRANNLMTGAQLLVTPVEFAQLSVSYMRKRLHPESYSALRADSLFNPYVVEIRPTATAEQYMSGDVNVEHAFVSAFGRYDYDLYLERTSRVQLFSRVQVLDDLALTGEYLWREPRLSYNSIFWVFTYNTLQEVEVGAEYKLGNDWQVFGRYGFVSYGDEQSQRITLGGSGRYGSASVSRNVTYDSEVSAASLQVGYPLWERMVTPTLLLSYAQYKLNASEKLQGALSAALGAVYRPIPTISLDTQVQWIQNKLYKNDVRLFFRGSYFFSERLDIF